MVHLKKEILKTLSYFDHFEHPLAQDEIRQYLRCKATTEELQIALEALIAEDMVCSGKGYFALVNKYQLCTVRAQMESVNRSYLRIGKFMGRVIQFFPYVKGVMISGSLSKMGIVNEKDADIDFFIITKHNRVYICRLILTAFKKLFLLNSKKYFCINFFRDENHLKFKSLDIYTATELTSLIPVGGRGAYDRLIRANRVDLSEFFPNFHNIAAGDAVGSEQKTQNNCGNTLNVVEKKARELFTVKAQKKYNTHDENVAIDYQPNSSAHFPESRHRAILEHYKHKCARIDEI